MAYGDGFVINLLYVFYCDAPEKKNPWLLSFLDHKLNNHNYNLINTVLQVYQTAWFSYNLIHLFHNIGFLEQCYVHMAYFNATKDNTIRIVQKFDPQLHSPCSRFNQVIRE